MPKRMRRTFSSRGVRVASTLRVCSARLLEMTASDGEVILFIDEAHTLIGAGGQAGQGDAANLLKPALLIGFLAASRRKYLDTAVSREIKDGQKTGVCGTPTVFVNGQRLQQRSLDGFSSMIDRELARRGEKCDRAN